MRSLSLRLSLLRSLQSPQFYQQFSTFPSLSQSPPSSSSEPIKLAILGSGLSGLSSAFYFLKSLPAHKSLGKNKNVEVVIFERSTRSGGWCESLEMPLEGKGKGKLVFETGPRSIRPVALAGWLTVQLVSSFSPLFPIFDLLEEERG